MLIAGRRARRQAAAARRLRVALFGNPNTGKTSLFNALCGTRAKTANFPGTTTAVRTGQANLDNEPATVLDLPGIYGFHHQSPETDIARDVLTGTNTPPPDAVIVVIDACNVIRNLVLVGELIAYGRPTIVALNMTDLAGRRGITVDARRLSGRLGVPVVPTVGRTGAGVEDLRRAAEWSLRDGSRSELPVPVPPIGATVESLVDWAERVTAGVVVETPSDARDVFTTRMDRVLMHPVLGLAIFAVMAASLFYTLFALAAIPMNLIEAVFASLSRLAGELLPAGPIRDLLTVGVVGGIAGTVVFLPQIALLFFFISLLEDTGYLARAAFVADRLLSRFGLPGHAFVPLLSAHACAVPAIMSTRLIPDRRDRLITVLVAPFMSCSARVPVYVMLTGVLFAGRPGYAALAFVGCYVLGASVALLTCVLFSRTIYRGHARPMVLELPAYKVPSLRNAVLTAKDQAVAFLRTAGTVIMAICIVMWWLSTHPVVAPPNAQVALAPVTASVEAARVRSQLEGSYAGRIGRLVEPAFRPLGFDWRLTLGVLTSYVAREVFVSTMSVIGGRGSPENVDEGVIAGIGAMTRDDGSRLFTPSTAAAALVFFVLAMQCLPTLVTTRRETGALKYAALQFVYMSSVAYAAAFAVHHALRAMGVS